MSITNLKPYAPIQKSAKASVYFSSVAVAMIGLSAGYAAAQSQAEITFKADKAIEVVFYSVRNGFQPQLFEEYFPQVMPYVMEAGGRPMGVLPIGETVSGNLNADTLAFFEWPSIDRYETFVTQPAMVDELLPIRDETIAYLNPDNFYTIKETTTVSIGPGKVFAAEAVWMDAQRKGALEQFEAKVGATRSEFGGRILVTLQRDDGSLGTYSADTVSLTEWPSVDAYRGYLASDIYRENLALRDQGAKRIDMFLLPVPE